MSGFKRATVSIGQDEYDRLREAEVKLRSLPDPAPDTQDAISAQSLDALRNNLEEMQSRQVNYQAVIAGMSVAMRDLEETTNAKIDDYASRSYAQFEEYSGCLWNYYDQLLSSQLAEYQELVLDFHRQNQAALAAHDFELRELASERNNKEAVASEWIAATRNLLLFIQEQYAANFFFPGRLARLAQDFQQSQNNYGSGMFEAAVASSQNVFSALTDFRLELEQQHSRWQVFYQAAWEAVSQVSSLLENSHFVPAYDLDGNELSYIVDVNYWTQDELVQVRNQVDQIVGFLTNEQSLPDSETLNQLLEIILPELVSKIEDIVLEARVKAINSQLRINVADLVIQALQEQGFTLSNSAYQGNDLRMGYGAELTNIEGNEVLIQVSPKGEGIGANELQIQSLDSGQKTEHELRRRWYEISQSLEAYGLDVGQYVRVDQGQENKASALRTVREKKPARLIRKNG